MNNQSFENADTACLLIYVQQNTSRFTYIVQTLIPEALITGSEADFLAFRGAKINYSNKRLCEEELFLVPHYLLGEKDIQPQQIACFEWEGMKVFFGTPGDIPFDIFSASFYLLSRYEEYLPYLPDQYGRYAHQESIAFREGFLNLPLVNLWLQHLFIHIGTKNQEYPKAVTRFSFVPTYDIDIAYSYQHQPVYKNVFGFYRDLLQGKFEQVMERGNVYSVHLPRATVQNKIRLMFLTG